MVTATKRAFAKGSMAEFLREHPCEVWLGSRFIGRFTNVYTACTTAIETSPACTVVTPYETLEPWRVRAEWAKGNPR